MPNAIEQRRDAIWRIRPDLQGLPEIIHESWDATALDIDDRWIFKFPRSDAAAIRLRREAAILQFLHDKVTLPIPRMNLHDGELLFSSHRKLPGNQLPPEAYDSLTEAARDKLAADLASFFAELHALPISDAQAAGAVAVAPLDAGPGLTARALPRLPERLREMGERAIADFRALAPDPEGDVFGFFDGHGWNMAYDHDRDVLGGIYDFADSGIGPLHREFVYPSFISPDLTRRVVTSYVDLTRRELDRGRIALLTTIVRLAELAAAADDDAHFPAMLSNAATWLRSRDCDKDG